MGWRKLADEVIRRRVELGHDTRASFIAASGISARTMGDIETARRDSYDRATLARLEKALGWEPGHLAELLRGEAHPTTTVEVTTIREADVAADFATLKGLMMWVAIDDSPLALMLELSGLDTMDMWEVVKMIRLRRQAQLNELMVEVRDELRRRGAPAPEHPDSVDWIDEWVARRKANGAAAGLADEAGS
jgi:hypothetical protein